MNPWRIAGLLAGLVGMAVGELVAAVVAPTASPYFAVGGAVVDLTPNPVKDFAIAVFGPADKLVLLVGIAAVLAGIAAYLGQLSRDRFGYAVAGIVLLTGVGVAAAVTRSGASAVDVLPSVLGGAGAVATLWWFHTWLPRSAEATAPGEPEAAAESRPAAGALAVDRRRLLVSAGVITGGALGVVVLSRWWQLDRFGAARSRAAVKIPRPASPAGPPPPDLAPGVPGLSRFQTPTGTFFRVDTALTVPQVRAEDWELRIHGMVSRPLRLTYAELLNRPLVERDVTIACVSNPVGGPYVGNARWTGVPLKDLLSEVGVEPRADQAVSRSVDGMTIGTPTAALTDGRDAMLAVAMNGEPLPLDHGFPVRMVVPGLYGYVSACKWIVEMELTTFAAYDAYWVKQGWAQQAAVKTASRIDTPRDGARVKPGTVNVAGVAWATHRGIEKVELRVDDGPWQAAELEPGTSADTWRQWVVRWRAQPGEHILRVRAIDGRGEPQTGEEAQPFPDGATGWHEIKVTVQQ